MKKPDVIIIGGGIAGVSLAGRLAGRAKVLLLERENQLAYHTTGRSAAMFVDAYGNAKVREWTRESRPFFEKPPEGFTDMPLFHRRATIAVAQPGEEPHIDLLLAESPEDVQPINAEKVFGLVPILRRDRFSKFAFQPRTADIDVHALFEGFRRMALRGGAEILTGRNVKGVEYGAQGWTVRAGEETYRTPIVVNAAGSWGGVIGRLAGLGDLGLMPLRRTAVMIAPPDGYDIVDWPVVMAATSQFYFKPDAGNFLASPEDETPSEPCDAQPEEIDVATIAHRIEEATTMQVRRIVRRWAGLRTFTPDRTPHFAFDEAAKDFFWLVGQGGYGMQTSPAISERAANLIAERFA
ncbi:MAG: FAD-dependent oxidoreductase [Alphaproteobacteria bacterium]|nr:FAD-dependent oxidoreductase [Alphaproteobacteria bacterium]